MPNWNIQVLTYFTLAFPVRSNEEQVRAGALISLRVGRMEICCLFERHAVHMGLIIGVEGKISHEQLFSQSPCSKQNNLHI